MPGIEQYESGWSNNENYKNTFITSDLVTAGFTWADLIDLDLSNGTVTQNGDFGSLSGVLLVATINTTTGGGVPSTPVSVFYVNLIGSTIPVGFSVSEGLAVNKCIFSQEINDGIVSISTATVAAPARSGIITLSGALTKQEIFTNTYWGPPDPGL